MIEPEYRLCPTCKESKLLVEFSGKWRTCKACDSERKKQNRQIKRAYVSEYLKTHSCKDCGLDNAVVLQFDHMHDKIRTISEMITRNVSLDTLKKEIEKCEVRCSNCHLMRHAKESGWTK